MLVGEEGWDFFRIYEEAKKNETTRETFSDPELRVLAHRIATNVSLPWFAPFSGTDGIKKRAAMEFAFQLVKKVAESRFLLSQMEHSFSSTSGLRDISKSEETRLVQNFSVLSEKLAYLNQILLSPEGRAVPDLRRLRSSM